VLQFRRNTGFTLYELLVTLALASAITSLAVPGFRGFMQSTRAVTHTNDLITALNLSRSEATRRGAPIDVCASGDGASCSGSTDWSDGWIVRTPAGEVLRVWPARSGGSAILTANVSTIRFQARGALSAGVAPLLTMQLPDCSGDKRRAISINVAGRISVNRLACL
jgi:type IV fimbrial biogenesis protein FimT